MDKHENPTTKMERINPSDAQTAHPFHPADLQVGADAMQRMMSTKPINDGFSIVDNHTKHTADGIPPAPGQGGDHMKHTADGMPPAPDRSADNMMHTSEAPNKASEDRIGSAAWIAKHAKPGEENLGKPPAPDPAADSRDRGNVFDHNSQAYRDHVKSIINNPYAQNMDQGGQPGSPAWASRENSDYIANLWKNSAPSDASLANARVPAPDNGDQKKEHHTLPNKFVHNWNKAPIGNADSPATPQPIALRGPNEDVVERKRT